MTARRGVSALLDVIDREARTSLPGPGTADALRYLVEAVDRLLNEPLEPAAADVIEEAAARMAPLVWLAADAIGGES